MTVTDWWGDGMVICLERGPDLHIAQLVSLPLTMSCSSKSRLVLLFWCRLIRVIPDKEPLNVCCCFNYRQQIYHWTASVPSRELAVAHTWSVVIATAIVFSSLITHTSKFCMLRLFFAWVLNCCWVSLIRSVSFVFRRHLWRQFRRSKRTRHCTVFLWFVELFSCILSSS